MEHGRTSDYQRPKELEEQLAYFASLLGPIESREVARLPLGDEPIVYVMGCPRSGTTLVYQYLSATGLFAYPTNFLSRFYYAPYLGARLQRMLFDCDFREEITAAIGDASFQSDLGKTKGPLAPHEFWYFWRRFFQFADTHQMSDEELAACDGAGFMRELRALQSVFARPLVLKGMILNWSLPYLAGLYEQSYFVIVQRDTAAAASSLLRARREFFGDEQNWYSFKPPGYDRVLDLSPPQQTAWQVVATNNGVAAGAAQVPAQRIISVRYEDFCENPRQLVEEITRRWDGETPQLAEELPAKFDLRRREDEHDWASIIESIQPYL